MGDLHTFLPWHTWASNSLWWAGHGKPNLLLILIHRRPPPEGSRHGLGGSPNLSHIVLIQIRPEAVRCNCLREEAPASPAQEEIILSAFKNLKYTLYITVLYILQ